MSAPSSPVFGGRLTLSNGREIQLGPTRLGRGGEGDVYPIEGDPTRVAKIYHNASVPMAKLAAMIKARPEDPSLLKHGQVSICWPDDLIFTSSRQVCGFTMPRLNIASYHPVGVLWNATSRRKRAPGFSWKYLGVAAANLCSMVELVHAKGHVVGDLNEENVLVNGSALAALVDCDSMQIRDPADGRIYRSTMVRPSYVSPERLGKQPPSDRTVEEDLWALAILLFAMLLEGEHPTRGVGYPMERERRLRIGIFPMLGERGFDRPPVSVAFEILPPKVQALFVRCFREGYKHPSRRPTATEWRRTLKEMIVGLRCGDCSPAHWYSSHLPSCPWCDDASGVDRFDFSSEGQYIGPTPAPSTPVLPAASQPAAAASTDLGDLFRLVCSLFR